MLKGKNLRLKELEKIFVDPLSNKGFMSRKWKHVLLPKDNNGKLMIPFKNVQMT